MRDKHVTVYGGLRRALFSAAAVSAMALAACDTGGAATATIANYQIGLAAYENEQVDQAIDIWKRFAAAGDVQSMKILGDIYSHYTEAELGKPKNSDKLLERVQLDLVEALKWYTLAAFHAFSKFQEPTALEVNAQILAEQRLPKVRFLMKDADVKKAEKLVSDTFERGSPYDLYRLGDMYQRGDGVAKDNDTALVMYAVAKTRGVGEASVAYETLVKAGQRLVTEKEEKAALGLAAVWQPPLPAEHQGETPQMKEDARLRKEIEELRLQDALEAVSDIDVELIQRALTSLGFYTGTINNTMDKETRKAIRGFQNSLVADDETMSPQDKEAVSTGVLSPRQTVELLAAAAKNGDVKSQYAYGIMHVRGIGVEQNGQEAVTWLTKAARADSPLANFALGVIYRDGTTGLNEVTPSKTLAARHFARALALGYEPARRALNDLDFEAPPKDQ